MWPFYFNNLIQFDYDIKHEYKSLMDTDISFVYI